MDPLEERWADVHFVTDAVLEEVAVCAAITTGGSDGCAQCTDAPTHAKPLTFKERIAKGPRHYDCAAELERTRGAQGVLGGLKCGGLTARLHDVLADPRLGQWQAAPRA